MPSMTVILLSSEENKFSLLCFHILIYCLTTGKSGAENSALFIETCEAVSLSQDAAVNPWAISGTTINITGYGSGSNTISVSAPISGSWTIEFDDNEFSLDALPSSGTGPNSSVTINAKNDSGQTGIHNITASLKNGSSVVDTSTIRVRITSQGYL